MARGLALDRLPSLETEGGNPEIWPLIPLSVIGTRKGRHSWPHNSSGIKLFYRP